jgi:hypothetical protein
MSFPHGTGRCKEVRKAFMFNHRLVRGRPSPPAGACLFLQENTVDAALRVGSRQGVLG